MTYGNHSANEQWRQERENSLFCKWLKTGAEEEYWEHYAEDYYRNRTSGPYFQQVLEKVIDAIPVGCDLLEIGPGPGVFTAPLASHVRRITAVDPSASVVNILKTKMSPFNNVRIINDYWENIPEEDFDVIFAAGVLYAFHDLESALSKMILHAGEKVVIVTVSDQQPIMQEVAGALGLPCPGPHSSRSELVLDVLRDITTSISYEWIKGEQIFQYPNIHMLYDSWRHYLAFSPEDLRKLELFMRENKYLSEPGNIISIPRFVSSCVIQVFI
jgi:ubiquinone/menaquinone biosynthesis C-methylase UbiE